MTNNVISDIHDTSLEENMNNASDIEAVRKIIQQSDDYYFLDVNMSFRFGSPKLMQNGEPLHARYILAEMLSKTKNTFKIVSDKLAGSAQGTEVWSWQPLVSSLEKFLKDGGRAEIILTQEPDTQSESWKIIEKYASKISIWLHKEPVLINKKKVNFAIADGTMYRYEYGTEAGEAIACAFDEKNSFRLESIFFSLTENATFYPVH